MTATTAHGESLKTAGGQRRHAAYVELAWIFGLVCVTSVAGLFLLRVSSPSAARGGLSPALLGWLFYLFGAAAILYRPRYGVYLLVFLTLVGDTILLPWYPFAKNFSSRESLFFLHNALIFSPLEAYMGLTLLSWLGRAAMCRKLDFHAGALFWPVIAFAGFITFGLAYGLGTGGSLNIGLWEARPIYYLPLMMILTGNLLQKRAHVSNILWAAMLAVLVEGIAGNLYFFVELEMDLGRAEAITEHAAAIHMNTLFVLVLAAWLYRASPAKRFGLPLMLPCVGLTYLATQRRAAFLSLGVALALLVVVLYRVNRRAFWYIVPPLTILGVLYLGAFWNSTGALGQPARAVKSVLVEEANERDYLSNVYRVIENINTDFTIHTSPLTGVGFGKKFFIIAPMPDISFFDWWEYITHNSILWIWMKTGIGGFVTLLYMIGLSIVIGVRTLWRMPGGDLSAVALTATLYMVMHFLYAYVDMSWDPQSMVYVGTMMGVLNSLERIVSRPVPVGRKRWRWQPEPRVVLGLLPVPGEEISLYGQSAPAHR